MSMDQIIRVIDSYHGKLHYRDIARLTGLSNGAISESLRRIRRRKEVNFARLRHRTYKNRSGVAWFYWSKKNFRDHSEEGAFPLEGAGLARVRPISNRAKQDPISHRLPLVVPDLPQNNNMTEELL